MARVELTLHIDSADDAASSEPHGEVSRMLRHLSDQLRVAGYNGVDDLEGPVNDINGNRVGKYEFTVDREDEE